MNKVPRLKKYAELFKRRLQPYLAPGITVRTVIFPVEEEGAVFEFLLNKDGDVTERVDTTSKSVGAVLGRIPQRFIGGQIEGVRFGGTNIAMEENRVLVIKGEDSQDQWTGNAVINDVQRVVSTSQGSRNQ